MSVLIKMAMPQNCRECRFMETVRQSDWNTVYRLDGRRYIYIAHLNEITNLKERLDTCPLEEVQEQKRGKWEDVEADEGEWICFKCSECGHDAYSYTGEILSNEWKFCPYCGVRTERSE